MDRVEGEIISPLIAAAHELKTPLVLLRQLSLLANETDDLEARAELLRRMRLTSERGLRLVDNLTKAARLDDAMFNLEPVQLGGLCEEVANELSPLGKSLKQEIICHHSSRKPVVAVASREILRSLLLGLTDNALQYNSGQKPIEISAFAKRRAGRPEAILAVRDHGPTLNLHEFRTLETTLGRRAMPIATRPLSSGLGLLIAQKFAGAMGGHLSVQRHASGGLTFMACLPLSRQLSLLEL